MTQAEEILKKAIEADGFTLSRVKQHILYETCLKAVNEALILPVVGIEFKEKDTLNFEAWKELRYKMIQRGILECKSTKTWKMLDDVFYEYKKEQDNQP